MKLYVNCKAGSDGDGSEKHPFRKIFSEDFFGANRGARVTAGPIENLAEKIVF